jgi:hypothetical protein
MSNTDRLLTNLGQILTSFKVTEAHKVLLITYIYISQS